jgi:serine/threonine protein kinase
MVHPNIIETHCLTNVVGEKFLAEELLPLVLNDDWMAGGIQEAANLLYDIGKALGYIHEELRLVHGDVKQDNIGSKDGHYILLDFGICRPIRNFICTATATGSLRTRAPELLETDHYPNPPKVDVWALAATVYKTVTGRFPFIDCGEVVPRVSKRDERSSFEEMLLRRIQTEWDQWADLEPVPEPLRQVLKAALVRDPEARADARTILSLCEKHLSGYLRGGKGVGRVSEMEELQQLVRYLPRGISLRLMPLSSKQILINRLDSYRQMRAGDPQTLSAVEELLSKLR